MHARPVRPFVLVVLATAGFLIACGAAPAPAPPPRYDVHQVMSAELLKQANRGRNVIGADGRFVLPGSVTRAWIDVGAHLLETTRPELEQNRDVAVFAIEPLAECWKAWPDNPRLIALPVAIAPERGSLDFNVNADDMTSSLLKTADGGLPGQRTVDVRKVPVLRLEDVLERIPRGIDVEYLKTDVQGLDLEVLKSAGEEIRRVRAVRAEVIDAPYYEGQFKQGTEADFVALMASKGFRFVGDSGIYRDPLSKERKWLDKDFVNPARPAPGWLARARARLRSWLT